MTLVDTGDETHDRRPAEARAELQSATSRSAAPTATASRDVDIDAPDRRFTARGRTLATVTAVQPPGRFGALDRWRHERRARLRGEAAGRRRLDQRRLLRPVARGHRLHRRRRTPLWEQEPLERLARDGQLAALPARRVLAADGHAARQEPASRSCGSRGKAPWKIWVSRGVLDAAGRVLVTGHTGFKGGWLASGCSALGREGDAATRSRPPTAAQPVRRSRASADGMTTIDRRRARRRALERRASRSRGPRSSSTWPRRRSSGRSYADRSETYATNVMGTANVLEAVRQAEGVRAVVVVTSDKCYENREWVWGYRENEPLGGHDPVQQQQGVRGAGRRRPTARSFFARRARHGVAIATARAGNVIGGGDWARGPARARLRAGARARRADRRSATPARSVRGSTCWTAARLPVLAAALWSDGPRYSEAWNFGPDDESARNVADSRHHSRRAMGRRRPVAPRNGGRAAARGRLPQARLLQGDDPVELAPALGTETALAATATGTRRGAPGPTCARSRWSRSAAMRRRRRIAE